MIKLMHLITGLDTGGAEMTLFKLLSRLSRDQFNGEVISLTEIGPVGEEIKALGYRVRAVGMQRGIPSPVGLLKLIRWFRQARPDLVQTWMYHADLMGGVAALGAGDIPVIWGLRQSNLDPEKSKRITLWTARFCAHLSRFMPERIVCCSEIARKVHIELGYAGEKITVIPNGFDLGVFAPDPSARFSVRRELGIPENTPLIGLVARFDPQKDHWNFIQAAARLNAVRPEVHFMLCGDGISRSNKQLACWIDSMGLAPVSHLLGRRTDIPRLMAAMDIAALSSSFGEGFPNVIGEAMACAIPCVVTDVGDSRFLVGDTGCVVAARDPQALANALQEMLGLGAEKRQELGEAARRRIEQHFSLPSIVARYAQLYEEIASGHTRRRQLA